MRFKALALDLDDTLLGPDRHAGPTAVRVVNRAASLGIEVVLATGRDHSSAKKLARELKTNGPVIANSGAVILDRQLNILRALTLHHDVLRKVLLRAGEQALLYVYSSEGVFTNRRHCKTDRYSKILRVPITVHKDLMAHIDGLEQCQLYGMSLRVKPGKAETLRSKWQQELDSQAEVIQTIPGLIEILPAGASKGNALRVLGNHLNIPPCCWAAVGDSMGDVCMLNAAGLGVLVANAPEKLHQQADWVTELPYTDGVLELLESLEIHQ